mmetsp:Transcript_15200/g.28589  ORF Transcript_15200/g.28589 Transcript_15200/m.28589 type:complete len:84 (+) Transcript_15200:999-1250(+)
MRLNNLELEREMFAKDPVDIQNVLNEFMILACSGKEESFQVGRNQIRSCRKDTMTRNTLDRSNSHKSEVTPILLPDRDDVVLS